MKLVKYETVGATCVTAMPLLTAASVAVGGCISSVSSNGDSGGSRSDSRNSCSTRLNSGTGFNMERVREITQRKWKEREIIMLKSSGSNSWQRDIQNVDLQQRGEEDMTRGQRERRKRGERGEKKRLQTRGEREEKDGRKRGERQ